MWFWQSFDKSKTLLPLKITKQAILVRLVCQKSSKSMQSFIFLPTFRILILHLFCKWFACKSLGILKLHLFTSVFPAKVILKWLFSGRFRQAMTFIPKSLCKKWKFCYSDTDEPWWAHGEKLSSNVCFSTKKHHIWDFWP